MRTLNHNEKRTVLICGAVIIAYFALFGFPQRWKSATGGRAEYQKLRQNAESLKREIDVYTNRV